jgi:hypothetical protein
MFRKLDLFPSSGEGRQTPSLLCPLERANFNRWTSFLKTQQSICLALPSPEDGKRRSLQNIVFLLAGYVITQFVITTVTTIRDYISS